MSERTTFPGHTMWREKGMMYDQIGEYLLHSPPIPKDKSQFLNPVTARQYDQFFVHTPLPTPEEYDALPKHKQAEIADREWDRRTNGVWFWNNGVATWIPGPYYFFLNYHRYGDEKPQYRNCHRQLYWVWCLFVMPHRNCLGIFLHCRRRWGKTSIAASIGNDGASGLKHFRVGIQSKTQDDAKALFLNEMQAPLTLMLAECPWFYQEVAGSTKPQSEFIFDKAGSKKKNAAKDLSNRGGLKSRIDWRASVETSYDSQGLRYFINDEVGKKQDYDPWARHSIVSKQFYPSGPVIGKEFATTTSDENDDDSVAKAKEFWDNSDPAKLDKRKGLARLFFPDTQGFECDKYGYDTAQSIQDLNDERIAAEQEGVISWIRRRRAYPRSIEEAHLESAKSDCVFNQKHIGDAQTCIAEHDSVNVTPLVQRYKLFGTPGAFALTPDPNGPVYASWIPPADWLNQIKQVGTVVTIHGEIPRYKPTGTKFGAGADPFDNVTTLSKGSKGAFHLGYEWDSKMEDRRGQHGYWPSHSFIVEVAERPDDPNDYYKLCLHLCMWAGCKMFCETNKVNLEKYFRENGGGDFLAREPVATMSEAAKQAASDPNNERTGKASSPRMIEEYTKAKVVFYQKYVGGPTSEDTVGNPHGIGFNDDGVPYDFRRMPFTRTLGQDLRFNPAVAAIRKKSDLSVSHGFALVHMTGFTIKPSAPVKANSLLKRAGGLLAQYR